LEEKSEKKSWEKRIKSKLTSYEWKKLRERIKIKEEFTEFQKEYRKHMSTFITGALGFVAALFWRDAITSIIEAYIPKSNEITAKVIIAFLVSSIAVMGIVLMSNLLEIKKE